MITPHAAELRLALFAIFAAGPLQAVDKSVCAAMVDASVDAAVNAGQGFAGVPRELLTPARLGAARVINSLCGACRACPRGRFFEPPALAPDPDPARTAA